MLKYLFFVILASGELSAETLYVSKNNSSLPSYFSTIQGAVDYAKPGDKIIVKPGVYRESVVISTNGLTVVSEKRHGAVLDGSEIVEDSTKCTLETCGVNDSRLVYFDIDWIPSSITQSDNVYNLCSSSDQDFPSKTDVSNYSHIDDIDFNDVLPFSLLDNEFTAYPIFGVFFNKGKYVRFIDSASNDSIVDYLNGSGFLLYDNRFSINNNLKYLDKNGEYCVLKHKSLPKNRIVLRPYDDSPLSVSFRPYGFYFKGQVDNVSISGFEVKNVNEYEGFKKKWDAGRGFFVASSSGGSNITISDNKIYNNAEGVEFRYRHGDVLENNIIFENFGNGVHLISGKNYSIRNNKIYSNLKDGLFVGSKPKSGGKDSVVNIHISGNHIYGHDSRFTHADSLQLYKVTDAYVYSNVIGDSTQPVWLQSLDNIVLFNNVFYGGVNKVRFNSHSDTTNVCAINNAFLNGVSVEKNISGFWLYNNIVGVRSVYHCPNCAENLNVKNNLYVLGEHGFQVYDFNGQHVFKNISQNADDTLGSGNKLLYPLRSEDFGSGFFYANGMSYLQVNPYYLVGESAQSFCSKYLYTNRNM